METTVDLAGCVGDVSGSKKVGNQIGMCVCPVFETLSSSSPPPLFFASKEIEEFFFYSLLRKLADVKHNKRLR